jgi:hypothetical protein
MCDCPLLRIAAQFFLGIGHWALGIVHWAQEAEEKKLVQQLSPASHLPISPSPHYWLAAALYWGFFAAIFSLM